MVRELCTLTGIHKTRTTPFHPRTDGLTERANRTLLQMLRAVTDGHPQEWPSKLPALLAAYKMSVNSTTVTTPNYAMSGREVLLPCTLIAAPPNDTAPNTEFVTGLRDNLREAHHRIHESLQTSARTEKRYFDSRVRYQQFRVDQFVWLYWSRPLIRSSHRKLVKLWTGPWRILRFDSPLVVQIQHTTSLKKQTVHLDRLMPCRAPEYQPEGDPSATDQQSNEHQITTSPMDSTAEVESTQSIPTYTRSRREIRRPARYL